MIYTKEIITNFFHYSIYFFINLSVSLFYDSLFRIVWILALYESNDQAIHHDIFIHALSVDIDALYYVV